jgi:hypothetical protein
VPHDPLETPDHLSALKYVVHQPSPGPHHTQHILDEIGVHSGAEVATEILTRGDIYSPKQQKYSILRMRGLQQAIKYKAVTTAGADYRYYLVSVRKLKK